MGNSTTPPKDITSTDDLAKIIWNYLQLRQPLEKCDAIFALGSSDLRIAEYAAHLFLDGYGEYLVISGGFGRITKDRFHKTEAEIFADISVQRGIPREKIILETKAANTGQNIIFTYEVLTHGGLQNASLLVVTKPYMERRAFATLQKQWPGNGKILITSPLISYEEYFTAELSKDLVINLMVGDIQRIKEYPKLGFQIEQDIPQDVWQTYEELISRGYNKALMRPADIS